jgi:hypothetical protein
LIKKKLTSTPFMAVAAAAAVLSIEMENGSKSAEGSYRPCGFGGIVHPLDGSDNPVVPSKSLVVSVLHCLGGDDIACIDNGYRSFVGIYSTVQ